MEDRNCLDIEPKRIGFSATNDDYSSNRKFVFGNSISELVDSVIEMNDINFAIKFVENYICALSVDELKKLEEFFLPFENNKVMVKFAKLVGSKKQIEEYDFTKIEIFIWDFGSIDDKIEISPYASEVFILKTQKEVIDSNEAFFIYTFADKFKPNEDNIPDFNMLYEGIKRTKRYRYIASFVIDILKKEPTFKERFWYVFW